MAKKATAKTREKPVPPQKIKLVNEIADKMKSTKTVMIASTKGLPSSQYHKIKKKLRDKAEVVFAKKTILERAIAQTKKEKLIELKNLIKADTCLMFSELDAYELAGVLIENQSPTKAKAGDIAPHDITIEAGGTDLLPGPAISELGAVGLKVMVENGKLAIRTAHVVVKEGEVINDKVAGVLGKLGVSPMKVGFLPVAAYDSKSEMIYTEIKIDKEGTLAELRSSISKAFGFAVGLGYATSETISFLIGKARRQEMAIEKLVVSSETPSASGGDGQ